MSDTFTARNVAKHAAQFAVSTVVGKTIASGLKSYTRIDPDSTAVEFGIGVVAWGIGDRLSPLTDKLVDKTADFISTKRANRKAKKDQKTTEEK